MVVVALLANPVLWLIAYQMQFQCEANDLLHHLQDIYNQGRTVVLLIDELDRLGRPIDAVSFLIKHSLDKQGRYLIFSSHSQFPMSCLSSSSRAKVSLPLPFCTDSSMLQNGDRAFGGHPHSVVRHEQAHVD